jgi:hypothetical protein
MFFQILRGLTQIKKFLSFKDAQQMQQTLNASSPLACYFNAMSMHLPPQFNRNFSFGNQQASMA